MAGNSTRNFFYYTSPDMFSLLSLKTIESLFMTPFATTTEWDIGYTVTSFLLDDYFCLGFRWGDMSGRKPQFSCMGLTRPNTANRVLI
jgi:hypothetical protein